VTLATLLTLLAAPAVWDVTALQPPTICQALPDPVCVVRDASDVLVLYGATIRPLPNPGGMDAWRQANARVADAAALRRDRAGRAGDGVGGG